MPPVTQPGERIVFQAELLFTREANGTVTVKQLSGDPIPKPVGIQCHQCNDYNVKENFHKMCGMCTRCCTCSLCTGCHQIYQGNGEEEGRRGRTGRMCNTCRRCDQCCQCIRCWACGTTHYTTATLCSICGCGRRDQQTHCRCCRMTNYIHFVRRPIDLQRWVPKTLRAFEQTVSQRLISAEIEITHANTGRQLDTVLEEWGATVVSDGSLGDGGFEINTAPASGEYFLKQIEDITNAAKAQAATADNRAGCHIHVDARDFGYYEIGKLIRLYGALEVGLYCISPSHRRESHFCEPSGVKYLLAILQDEKKALTDPASTPEEREALKKRIRGTILYQVYGKRDANTKKVAATKNCTNRYRAFNLHSWLFRKTVEFRMPAGSVQYKHIMGWGLLLANIMDMAHTLSIKSIDKLIEPTLQAILVDKETACGKVDYVSRALRVASTRLLLETAPTEDTRKLITGNIGWMGTDTQRDITKAL